MVDRQYRGSAWENEVTIKNGTRCLMCNLTVGNWGMNVLVWLESAECYNVLFSGSCITLMAFDTELWSSST